MSDEHRPGADGGLIIIVVLALIIAAASIAYAFVQHRQAAEWKQRWNQDTAELVRELKRSSERAAQAEYDLRQRAAPPAPAPAASDDRGPRATAVESAP